MLLSWQPFNTCKHIHKNWTKYTQTQQINNTQLTPLLIQHTSRSIDTVSLGLLHMNLFLQIFILQIQSSCWRRLHTKTIWNIKQSFFILPNPWLYVLYIFKKNFVQQMSFYSWIKSGQWTWTFFGGGGGSFHLPPNLDWTLQLPCC